MITGDVLLQELERVTYKTISAQYNEKTALKCCDALCLCLHLNFKSRLMYVPTTNKQLLNVQHERIFNDFSGRNHKELAIKYHLAEGTIYSIIKRHMKAAVRDKQHDIFPVEEPQCKKHTTSMVIEDYLPTEIERCGVAMVDAQALCDALSIHLCETFPGISVVISKAMINARAQRGQEDLFM